MIIICTNSNSAGGEKDRERETKKGEHFYYYKVTDAHAQQQSALIIILFEKGCGKNAILVLTTGWKHRTAGTCEDEWVRNTRKEQLLFCCTEGLEQTDSQRTA